LDQTVPVCSVQIVAKDIGQSGALEYMVHASWVSPEKQIADKVFRCRTLIGDLLV
jgi:hypothetical protein